MTLSTVPQDSSSSRMNFASPNATLRSSSGARFSLRKRTARADRETVNLSSYNSDFLSGLFADVAKVTVLTELGMEQKRGSEVISDAGNDTAATQMPPAKKSRMSVSRYGSCPRSSCMDLTALSATLKSPKGINDFFDHSSKTNNDLPTAIDRHDSLAFQLNCVSSMDDSTESTVPTSLKHKTVEDACLVAFPQLPTTVSDGSCATGLTRAKLDRHVSTRENDAKDHFGWFVDLEGEIESTPVPSTGLPIAVSCDDLAFQAPTAPKRVNDDAELAAAQAADTIDDVLGDFF